MRLKGTFPVLSEVESAHFERSGDISVVKRRRSPEILEVSVELAQGMTMKWVLSRLGLIERGEAELEHERRRARLVVAHAARERLEQRFHEGMISAATWERVKPELDQRIEQRLDAQRQFIKEEPHLPAEELGEARREALRAGRATLGALWSDGVISDGVYDELVKEIDNALAAVDEEATSEKLEL